jgi:hypothetical protein
MKRFVSGMVVVGLVTAGILVAGDAADANGCISHSTGDGTSARPFLINTAFELTCIEANPVDYWGADLHFLQTNDIDMQAEGAWTQGIGIAGNPFLGSFDGAGHTISHLQVTEARTNSDIFGVGMFGQTGTGSSVTGVRLLEAAVSATASTTAPPPESNEVKGVGLLLGVAGGVVSGNEASGHLTVDATGNAAQIGGLVGAYSGSSTAAHLISNATISVSATDVEQVGGLAGSLDAADLRFGRSSGSIQIVAVDDAAFIGGLVGINNVGVADSLSTTSVIVSVDPSGYASEIGGLVGYAGFAFVNRSGESGSVQVTGTALGRAVGGLVGLASASVIADSYATGDVTSSVNEVGGLVGVLEGSNVSRTYGAGKLSGVSAVGGIAGTAAFSSQVTDSFWDSTTTGASTTIGLDTDTVVTHVTALPTAPLFAFATFVDTTSYLGTAWDIHNGFESPATTIWGICDGQTYPFLTALTSTDPCTPGQPTPAPAVAAAVLAATGLNASDIHHQSLAALLLALLGTAVLVIARRRKHAFRP